MKNFLFLCLGILALSGSWCVFSWRQTPDQHKYLTYAMYNAAVTTYHAAQASDHVNQAVAPLADPKTGLSPSMKQFLKAVSGGATNLSTVLGTVNTQTTNLGNSVTEIKNALVPGLNSANQLIQTANTTTGQIGALAKNYSALPDRLAYANRWLWDCHEFSGCLQSQALGLVGSARYTLGKVARASDQFPALVTTFQVTNTQFAGIGTDVHHMTTEIDKRYFMPQPLKTRIWHGVEDGIALGGSAARNLLP